MIPDKKNRPGQVAYYVAPDVKEFLSTFLKKNGNRTGTGMVPCRRGSLSPPMKEGFGLSHIRKVCVFIGSHVQDVFFLIPASTSLL